MTNQNLKVETKMYGLVKNPQERYQNYRNVDK